MKLLIIILPVLIVSMLGTCFLIDRKTITSKIPYGQQQGDVVKMTTKSDIEKLCPIQKFNKLGQIRISSDITINFALPSDKESDYILCDNTVNHKQFKINEISGDDVVMIRIDWLSNDEQRFTKVDFIPNSCKNFEYVVYTANKFYYINFIDNKLWQFNRERVKKMVYPVGQPALAIAAVQSATKLYELMKNDVDLPEKITEESDIDKLCQDSISARQGKIKTSRDDHSRGYLLMSIIKNRADSNFIEFDVRDDTDQASQVKYKLPDIKDGSIVIVRVDWRANAEARFKRVEYIPHQDEEFSYIIYSKDKIYYIDYKDDNFWHRHRRYEEAFE